MIWQKAAPGGGSAKVMAKSDRHGETGVRTKMGRWFGGLLNFIERKPTVAALDSWTIERRLTALVLALAVPLNILVVVVVWHVASAQQDYARNSLQYTARAVAQGVDAEVDKYIRLADALSRSPALVNGDIGTFEAEARAIFADSSDAYVVVGDLDGQLLLNLAATPGQKLPPRPSSAVAAQRLAASKRAPVVSSLRRGPIATDWVFSVELPVIRGGEVVRALGVVVKPQGFVRLLNAQSMPANWLAGIIDQEGRFIARVPGNDRLFGALASNGFRASRGKEGVSEILSLEAKPIVQANAVASLSGWTVGIAIHTDELLSTALGAMAWAAGAGVLVSTLSLILAALIARRITQPIKSLHFGAQSLLRGDMADIDPKSPEISEVWDSLRQVAAERRRAEAARRESEERSQEALRRINADLETRVRQEVEARELAQAKLLQSEKLAALGQLAGGVAHDFNNILQTMLAGASQVERRSTDPKIAKVARLLNEAAQRGASITRRLLSFARQGELRPEPVDVAATLNGLREMMMATISPNYELCLAVADDLPWALVDKGQLEAALVNLIINARDATPDGGAIEISAKLDGPPDPLCARDGARFVRFAVADHGTGMDEATVKRALEPFFTTKGSGAGTGLGLPMARSFAEQSGGALAVDSAPGRGTIVSLWIPVAAEAAFVGGAGRLPALTQSERRPAVLLVGDEDALRHMLAAELAEQGFQLVEAADGIEALRLLGENRAIDVLVTDLAMPGMNGVDLIREAQAVRPGLAAILITGNAMEAATAFMANAEGKKVGLVRKPIDSAGLAERIMGMVATSETGEPLQKERPGAPIACDRRDLMSSGRVDP
ncbi:hypothetical protein CH337_17075 [Rhodoblastus acidophilus]|nr:hypothetical protein CKO16_20525 [Rhodoblastus acidophilus]RAI17282.1 hypothetical protein CH337_17075 [Rhodoblastus acidophilus]